MNTFEKPLEEHSEEELYRGANHSSLDGATAYLLEVLRRRLREVKDSSLELRDEVKNFGKVMGRANTVNGRMTAVLCVVALFQLFIATFQLTVAMFGPGPKAAWVAVGIDVLISICVIVSLRQFMRGEKD